MTKPVEVFHGSPQSSHEKENRCGPQAVSGLYIGQNRTRENVPLAYGGTKEFLEQLGFEEVVEAQPLKTYALSLQTSITYVVNGLDSIMVIESAGQVFVNVNDSLHSHPRKVQDLFINIIRSRWPRIDTVFSGFGGSSYFPNTIHCPGKNDVEIGEAREQLYASNFCRIVHGLGASVGVPFAADFALLSPRQQWINQLRFPRARMADYFRELYAEEADSFRIFPMYSGDALEDGQLRPDSPYRAVGIEQLPDPK